MFDFDCQNYDEMYDLGFSDGIRGYCNINLLSCPGYAEGYEDGLVFYDDRS